MIGIVTRTCHACANMTRTSLGRVPAMHVCSKRHALSAAAYLVTLTRTIPIRRAMTNNVHDDLQAEPYMCVGPPDKGIHFYTPPSRDELRPVVVTRPSATAGRNG